MNAPVRDRMEIGEGMWLCHDACYVLVGGSDGLIHITARLKDNIIDALVLEPQGAFGGWVWSMLADAFVGLPLERNLLMELIDRYQKAGIIPSEVQLQPLVTTLVKLRA
ncbi:MAG: hypothetical protein HY741_22075 [Chloroflexi bacterium]|nr:hypothetical protein [Chloroflexota bacterium]